MKKMNKMNKIFLLIIGVLFLINANASVTYLNSPQSIGLVGTQSEFSDSLIIGPSANITVVNDWMISSIYVKIDPAAKITGTGHMIFASPITFKINGIGKPAGTIIIDEGNVLIDVNIRMENPSNMDLKNSNFYVGKDFDLRANGGHVILNAQNIIFDANATISQYTEDKYFVTNSTGSVVKEAMTTFIFPVGNTETIGTGTSADYTPASLTNSGTSDNFSVRVFLHTFKNGTSGGNVIKNSIDKTWMINEAVAGGSNLSVTLQHNESTEGSTYKNYASNHFVTRYSGTVPNSMGDTVSITSWENMKVSSQSADISPGTLTTGVPIASGRMLTRTGFTTLSPFSKGVLALKAAVLPISLLSFEARKNNDLVHLEWETANEINSGYFEIERSIDAENFNKVGINIEAAKNSNFVIKYNMIDNIANIKSSIIYYRLKMVNIDGTYKYSRIKAVFLIDNQSSDISIMAFPNPNNGKLTININELNAESNYKYIIANAIGLTLIKSPIRSNLFEIDLSDFTEGSYLIKIIENRITIKTIIIQKVDF